MAVVAAPTFMPLLEVVPDLLFAPPLALSLRERRGLTTEEWLNEPGNMTGGYCYCDDVDSINY